MRIRAAVAVLVGILVSAATANGGWAITPVPTEPRLLRLAIDVEQSNPLSLELGKLFEDLKAAKTSTDAQTVEQQIWATWMQSGDAGIDQLVSQSIAAMNTGQLEESLAILDAVVSKAPSYAEGWNKRATVLYMAGQLDRSLADIEKVLALEPRHFGAISGIGLIKVQQGDPAGALFAFKKVLEIYPLSPGALQNIEALETQLEGDPT